MYKLSIITIAFNCAFDLEATVKSVLNQTFRDFEYIVIDGGSKDGSLEVIKKYESAISKWVSEPDNGIYDAMNKGLKMATGEYVLFMNAGDTFYASDSLSKVSFSQNPDADIFYGEALSVDEEGKELGLRPKKLPHKLNWKHFKRGMVVCHQSFIVRRTLAPAYNLHYQLSADVEWVLRCLKDSNQTVFTGTIISRFLEGGASKKRHSESLKERFIIMQAYFGLTTTILSHIRFVFGTVSTKLGLKSTYRKNYL